MMLSMELQHRQPPLSLCRDDSSLSCLPPFSSLPFQPIDGSDGDATWPWTLTPLSPLVFSPTDSRDDDASSPSLSSSPTPSSAPPPLSSSSSSSSDSASLEWSSSPSSSPTPKRPRAEGSEVAVVLAAPVKRSHREIDADRRQKEAAIVRRLEELTQEDEEGGLVGLSSKRKGGKGLRGRRKRKVVKRDKVAVLRACADRLERLEALVAQLTSVPNARDQHVKALASHLTEVAEYNQQKAAPGGAGKGSTGLLPASTAEGLAFLDRHHALYSALFVQGNCAIALIDIDTGILLDANKYTQAPQPPHLLSSHRLRVADLTVVWCDVVLCGCVQWVLCHERLQPRGRDQPRVDRASSSDVGVSGWAGGVDR